MKYEIHEIINIDCGNREMRYKDMDAFKRALKRYAKKGYHPYIARYMVGGYWVAVRKAPKSLSSTPGHQRYVTFENGRKFQEYHGKVYEVA